MDGDRACSRGRAPPKETGIRRSAQGGKLLPLRLDAGVAIKWVIEEAGTPEALALRKGARLIAPDLLISECSNILWRKVQRNGRDAG